MSDNQSSHEQLWELIHDIKFGMLVAQGADGALKARPLTTQNKKMDQGGSLWFFISRSSELASDLRAHPKVNLSYADPGDDSYVSIAGTAALVEDRAKVEELFNTAAKAWFPQGKDDPDLQLLRVSLEGAEFWDVKDSKMVQLFKMATAAVTGNPPDMTEHKELKLK